jgi:3-deoxy-D-manno-oct-2-ulosonic acid (Kdo) hydroxylase
MELVTVNEVRPDAAFYRALEGGNILLVPRTPWDLPADDQEYLRGVAQSGSGTHKNVAYRPGPDKVTGFDREAVPDPMRLRAVMRRFSAGALEFLRTLLPRYMRSSRTDYASFRGVEEEGRKLDWKKRNDLLHVDAFPTRPTGGDLILRTFVNINLTRPRVWLTSEPFEALARQYAAEAGWPRVARWDRLKGWLTRRGAYDRFMLRFHDFLKRNREYQEGAPKYRWEFWPGATWIVFTDIVPHAVLAGQHALEQTVIVSRETLLEPGRAPIEILSNLKDSL